MRHPQLALACAAMALTCLAAEVALRVAWHPDAESHVIAPDSLCGWALRPGSRLHSVASDRGLDYHIAINSLGLRDRERALQSSPGSERVLFLGDSMVFGAGVEQDARVTERLETILGPGVEVVNAGVSGWGTDQEFLWFQRQGLALHPDVVVLGLCMLNDVVNNLLPHELFGTAPKPRFELQDERLVLHFPAPRSATGAPQAGHQFLKRSRLVHFVGRHVQLLRTRLKAPPPHGTRVYYPEDLESDSSHWAVFRRNYPPRFEAAFRVTESLVAALHDSCAVHGIRLVLFAFPQKVEVDSLERAAELAHFGYDPAQFDLQKPYRRLQELAARLRVSWLYPLPEWGAVHRRTPLFFERDGHPNAAGHRLAAQELAPVLHAELTHAVSSRR